MQKINEIIMGSTCSQKLWSIPVKLVSLAFFVPLGCGARDKGLDHPFKLLRPFKPFQRLFLERFTSRSEESPFVLPCLALCTYRSHQNDTGTSTEIGLSLYPRLGDSPLRPEASHATWGKDLGRSLYSAAHLYECKVLCRLFQTACLLKINFPWTKLWTLLIYLYEICTVFPGPKLVIHSVGHIAMTSPSPHVMSTT